MLLYHSADSLCYSPVIKAFLPVITQFLQSEQQQYHLANSTLLDLSFCQKLD
jgi:hypothetical protein